MQPTFSHSSLLSLISLRFRHLHLLSSLIQSSILFLPLFLSRRLRLYLHLNSGLADIRAFLRFAVIAVFVGPEKEKGPDVTILSQAINNNNNWEALRSG